MPCDFARGLLAAVALLSSATLPARASTSLSGNGVGKGIFYRGEGMQLVTARLGSASGVIPASLLTCAGCHGNDARGGREAGLTAPSLRWQELTQAQSDAGVTHRKRSAYDRTLLARAIRDGVDASGQVLHAAMPRFSIGDRDLDALLDFLQDFERSAPGVSLSAVRVATVLPASGAERERGQAMVTLLQSVFANSTSTVHGRRIELDVIDLASRSLRCEGTDRLCLPDVAAWIAPLVDRTTVESFVAAAASERTPILGLPGGWPQDRSPPEADQVFLRLPTLREQWSQAAKALAIREGAVPIMVVDESDDARIAEVELARAFLLAGKTPPVSVKHDPKRLTLAPEAPLIVAVAGERVVDTVTTLQSQYPQRTIVALAAHGGSRFLRGSNLATEDLELAYFGPLPAIWESLARSIRALGDPSLHAQFGRDRAIAWLAAQWLLKGLESAGRELAADGLRAGLVAQVEREQRAPEASTLFAFRWVRPDPKRGTFVEVSRLGGNHDG